MNATTRGPGVEVKHDTTRGHIAVYVPGNAPHLTFADLGPVLSFWAYEGGELDPSDARRLGEALAAWADSEGGDQ